MTELELIKENRLHSTVIRVVPFFCSIVRVRARREL